MDEFRLIERIHNTIEDKQPGVRVGIGDDAAIIQPNAELETICCVDTLCEGVHFKRSTMKPADIGYKALAVNISDVAAMGGKPKYYLVSIAVPRGWSDDEVLEIYDGMQSLAQQQGVHLIGGDSVTSKSELYISVTVLGEVAKGRALLRSSARVGDVVFVTGSLGGSAAGLEQLLNQDANPNKAFVEAHQRPLMHTGVAQMFTENSTRMALNDISDGLSSEIWEIAESSDVHIELEESNIPMPELMEETFGRELSLRFAFNGGEDFQLLGTVSKEDWPRIAEEAKRIGDPLTIIGHVIGKGADVTLNSTTQKTRLVREGYTHRS
ncbi:thiamine-phosphate kinase [Geomicrobium sp. JSM 1781026]|uniref:thiamine-phosphate kinase n=1 Tax=Geomicrobium sp. JSM 1781026 TaxID=3344580 RepID=UPI0035BFAA79